MAFLGTKKLWCSVFIVYICVFCHNIGKAAAEVPPYGEGSGYVPGFGGDGGDGPRLGGPDDPTQIVAKALLCFNDQFIYKSCVESYRLDQSGDLHIPPENADEYCTGPCLEETNLVLDCINNILDHFIFYNRATIRDIRDTIHAGCGYGPERGRFNVAEHIAAEGDGASRPATQILLQLAVLIIASWLFLGHV